VCTGAEKKGSGGGKRSEKMKKRAKKRDEPAEKIF
jgi:hypothetical protein